MPEPDESIEDKVKREEEGPRGGTQVLDSFSGARNSLLNEISYSDGVAITVHVVDGVAKVSQALNRAIWGAAGKAGDTESLEQLAEAVAS